MSNMQRNMTNMQCGSIVEHMQENMQNMQNLRTMPKICKICAPHLADDGISSAAPMFTSESESRSRSRRWLPLTVGAWGAARLGRRRLVGWFSSFYSPGFGGSGCHCLAQCHHPALRLRGSLQQGLGPRPQTRIIPVWSSWSSWWSSRSPRSPLPAVTVTSTVTVQVRPARATLVTASHAAARPGRKGNPSHHGHDGWEVTRTIIR